MPSCVRHTHLSPWGWKAVPQPWRAHPHTQGPPPGRQLSGPPLNVPPEGVWGRSFSAAAPAGAGSTPFRDHGLPTFPCSSPTGCSGNQTKFSPAECRHDSPHGALGPTPGTMSSRAEGPVPSCPASDTPQGLGHCRNHSAFILPLTPERMPGGDFCGTRGTPPTTCDPRG